MKLIEKILTLITILFCSLFLILIIFYLFGPMNEIILNSRSIIESLTDEQELVVSFLLAFSIFVFGFVPIIESWTIRLFKRLIKFIHYLLKRKDDSNETTNR